MISQKYLTTVRLKITIIVCRSLCIHFRHFDLRNAGLYCKYDILSLIKLYIDHF